MSQKLYFGTNTPLASRSHSVPRRRTRSAYDHFIRESDAEAAHRDFKVAEQQDCDNHLLKAIGRAQLELALVYRGGKYSFTK